MGKELTRRNFIGAAALGAAAMAAGGLAACSPGESSGDSSSAGQSPDSGTWDMSTDLLICGSGGAGMACAIEAKDNGVENVLIIEKRSNVGGTTTTSQGMIAGFDTQIQKKQDIKLTYDEMYANLMNNATYHLDPALTKITVERCGEIIDWLIDRVQVPFTEDVAVYYGPLQMMHIVEEGGAGFAQAFGARLDELGVETEKETKLVEILLDTEGRVAGAVAEGKKGTVRIQAKAIMIATGGYAYNPELAARLDPEKAGTFGIGYLGSEGDGLIAASNAGAATSHTNDMMCVLKDYVIMSEHEGTSASANVNGFTLLPNVIFVGAEGKRFTNEGDGGFMSQNFNGPVFDQMHRDNKGFVWQVSDEAAITATDGKTKRGEGLEYIKGADAAELAANMGVDAENLAATIDAYNAAVDAGFDAEFGRLPTVKLVPPFVALPVVPCEIITYGGIARNENGEVICADGTPIPGLYVGGEASCNSAYMGFTLSNCFTWGRIGGKSASDYIAS
ncbi:FAD-dependent oxidoreductase [Raoultibacter phocaeensis]|uniref:FAD-dependent oxidoreductase n=1 Tax=Raoultibacter phocaeensis TaxID=2479841 RepID=UPI001119BCC3|nr:FAD-dependent oxidoreductase [Raoultibacter phocaeensis]